MSEGERITAALNQVAEELRQLKHVLGTLELTLRKLSEGGE